MNGSDLYTVKVKNGARWREYDVARLQVSVGQAYHEGEKLLATLEWANDRFEKTIICVNDTLQRHNLIFEGEEKNAALDNALKAGKEWLHRNNRMISSLANYEVIRWEEWRSEDAYNYGLQMMERLYRDNQVFKKDVNDEIESFWHRSQKRENAPAQERYEEFKEHSLNYLLEECAAFQLMFARDIAVDIYPGSTLLPCKLSKAQNLGTRGYTRIDFRRKAA